MFIDRKKQIWIGSWGSGLSLYDEQLSLIKHFKHNENDSQSLGSNKVQVIFEDQQGEIWIGTNGGGLTHYLSAEQRFVNFNHDPADQTTLRHNRVWSIAQSEDRLLWLATSEGLNKFDKQTHKFERFYHDPNDPDSLSHSLVRTLAFGQASDELWVGTEAGMGSFNINTGMFSELTLDNLVVNRSITRFLFDRDNNLWIGTQTGLLKFDIKSRRFVKLLSNTNKVLFPIDDIRDMHFDNTGLLWLATRYAGLVKVDLGGSKIKRIDQYTNQSGQIEKIDGIKVLFKDHKDVIWIATWTKLLYMEPNSGSIRDFEPYNYFDTQTILTISEDDSGTLWLGGNQGISAINPQRTEMIRRNDLLEGLPIKGITSLFSGSDDILWIGTTHVGLFKYAKGKRSMIQFKEVQTLGKPISSIYQDDRQLIWISMSVGGIFQFDPTRETAKVYHAIEGDKNSLSHDQVSQIYQDKDGDIWLASKKYLNKLNDVSGGFDYFGVKQGLNSNDIKSIIEDNSGDLWLGTAAGISQYRSLEERFTNYTMSEGLEQNSYYFEAAVKDNRGNVYFGGNHGIDRITPSQANVNHNLPPVRITKLWVDNNAVKRDAFLPGKPLELGHQVKNIRFGFAALDFKDPQKNLYTYRLIGFDDDWYGGGIEHHASYTSLDPGTYTFEVKGSNNSGVYNPEPSRFTFTITPPFYRTLWFYLLSGLSATLFMVARSYKYRARKRALLLQVEEKTAELKVLGEIGKQLNATLDMESIFMLLHHHLRNILDAHAFAIGILNKDASQIDFKLIVEGDNRLPPIAEPMHGSGKLSAWCIKNEKEAIVNEFKDVHQYLTIASQPSAGDQMESIVYLPLRDNSGKITGCITMQSPRKNAYTLAQIDMLRTLASYTAIALNNASAYAQVEQSNAEILAAQQQLIESEKMASLGELTTGVAHEINNPTNFVHGCAQLLQTELVEFQDFIDSLVTEEADQAIIDSFAERFDDLFKHLNTIVDGSQRIKAIVQDLRAFTRLDEAEIKSVHIGDCITSTLNLIKAKYAQEVTFETSFEVNPLIKCRPSRLNQVFMNIVVNACDAITEEAQKPANGLVKITVSDAGDFIVIVIKANGSGMNAKTKEKLFEPFYTTKPVGKGTGLGLSISFGIISDHNGTIKVNSELGQGSEFVITLPVID
ncbi:MAG: ATP-binding protein [Psychrosphaera sp.]|nr:ATP-binding protein [Psychrosphaera sp.]